MHPFRATALLFALLAPALPLACSSSTPSATSGCTDYTKAYCQKIAQCDSITMESDFANNVDACLAAFAPDCTAVLSLTGTGLTPAWLEGCANAMNAEPCSDYASEKPLPACVVPPGSFADGVACFSGDQCKSGNCESSNVPPAQGDADAGSTCGTCTEPTTSKTGCEEDSDCPGDEVCAANVSTGANVCESPLALGATCGAVMGLIIPCQSGLECQAAGDGGTEATCQPFPGAGQPCSTAASLYGCASGFICNVTCVAPEFVPVGGSCSLNPAPGAAVQVCAAGDCINGACVAFAAIGAPCAETTTVTTPTCTPGASCVSGKCESESAQIPAACK
jgi:hypothetical protein